MPEAVAEIAATTLKQRLDQGEALALLDVREAFERDHARISAPETAVDLHVPLGEVARWFEEIEEAAKGLPLVVYCHHGQRSMVAATWLARRGIGAVANLDGGIEAWSIRVDRSVKRY